MPYGGAYAGSAGTNVRPITLPRLKNKSSRKEPSQEEPSPNKPSPNTPSQKRQQERVVDKRREEAETGENARRLRQQKQMAKAYASANNYQGRHAYSPKHASSRAEDQSRPAYAGRRVAGQKDEGGQHKYGAPRNAFTNPLPLSGNADEERLLISNLSQVREANQHGLPYVGRHASSTQTAEPYQGKHAQPYQGRRARKETGT
jgi:hypothetical protein